MIKDLASSDSLIMVLENLNFTMKVLKKYQKDAYENVWVFLLMLSRMCQNI